MPLSSVIALGAIVVAFMLFAIVLAWGEFQTRRLAQNKGPARPYKLRHELLSSVDEKGKTATVS